MSAFSEKRSSSNLDKTRPVSHEQQYPETSSSRGKISNTNTSSKRSKKESPSRLPTTEGRSWLRREESNISIDCERPGTSIEHDESKASMQFAYTKQNVGFDNDNDSSDDQDDLRLITKSQSVVSDSKIVKETTVAQRKAREGHASESDLEDEKQMLLDVQQNIANIEKSMSVQEKMVNVASKNKAESSPDTPRKR